MEYSELACVFLTSDSPLPILDNCMFLCKHEPADQVFSQITTAGNTLTLFHTTTLFSAVLSPALTLLNLPASSPPSVHNTGLNSGELLLCLGLHIASPGKEIATRSFLPARFALQEESPPSHSPHTHFFLSDIRDLEKTETLEPDPSQTHHLNRLQT